MRAVTEEIAGSHVAFISHPAEVAVFIVRALEATGVTREAHIVGAAA